MSESPPSTTVRQHLRATGDGETSTRRSRRPGVEDFFELGMLMCRDALEREESPAGTSVSSTSRRRARRSATGREPSPTSRRGSGPAIPTRRSATSSLWSTRSRTSRLGAKSDPPDESDARIWRQSGPTDGGHFEDHTIAETCDEASFLELLDILNERLIGEGKEAIAFDHDAGAGSAGTCSLMIDGQAHWLRRRHGDVPARQRKFESGYDHGRTVARATRPDHQGPDGRPGPLDRIVEAAASSPPDGRARRQPDPRSEVGRRRIDGRGRVHRLRRVCRRLPERCADLFTGAKLTHLDLLPQGEAERFARTEAMVETMEEYFGSCTNHGECEAACPKSISIDVIAVMNADYLKATSAVACSRARSSHAHVAGVRPEHRRPRYVERFARTVR